VTSDFRSYRLSSRWSLLVVVVILGGALLSACVDNFNGSVIELYLHGGVQVPGDDPGGFGRPPSDTHYEIYVGKDSSVFHVIDFDIRPVIDMANPCFIEEAGARFAGLHSTQIVAKTIDAAMADGTVDDVEAGDIANAMTRFANMGLLQASLKALTLHEAGLTNAVLDDLLQTVPPADMTDDATNAQRLAVCQAIWRKHPGDYVGTDKVLSVPLNGVYYGLVQATDPRNGSFLGGGSVDSSLALDAFDSFRVNWNWNDPADARKANYPPSTIGYHYMAGKPVQRERGVTNVSIVNDDFTQIAGDVSIFTNLGEDDVHF
jgi:hypothetical protein